MRMKEHAEILQVSTSLPTSPHGCTSQGSLVPCAELVLMASPRVTLRTPCQHPNHAFIKLILSLTQMQSAGNTTGFILALWAPSRMQPWVPISSQQTKRQEAVGFFRRLVPSAQGMGKQS